jgi:hypothetical protein
MAVPGASDDWTKAWHHGAVSPKSWITGTDHQRFPVAQITVASPPQGDILATTLYDVRRQMATLRASSSEIGHRHRSISLWDNAV